MGRYALTDKQGNGFITMADNESQARMLCCGMDFYIKAGADNVTVEELDTLAHVQATERDVDELIDDVQAEIQAIKDSAPSKATYHSNLTGAYYCLVGGECYTFCYASDGWVLTDHSAESIARAVVTGNWIAL